MRSNVFQFVKRKNVEICIPFWNLFCLRLSWSEKCFNLDRIIDHCSIFWNLLPKRLSWSESVSSWVIVLDHWSPYSETFCLRLKVKVYHLWVIPFQYDYTQDQTLSLQLILRQKVSRIWNNYLIQLLKDETLLVFKNMEQWFNNRIKDWSTCTLTQS